MTHDEEVLQVALIYLGALKCPAGLSLAVCDLATPCSQCWRDHISLRICEDMFEDTLSELAGVAE
jgi:hypothetical protein